jgi:hypothetical protein
LSDDGRARLARVAAVLASARASRAALAERVNDAWRALGGPSTLDDALDLVAVDDTIALVAAHERAGDVDDWNALVARLAGERASPSGGVQARVQVMTMHKAKGSRVRRRRAAGARARRERRRTRRSCAGARAATA